MISSASHEAVDDCGDTTRSVVPGVPESPLSPFSPFSPLSPFPPAGPGCPGSPFSPTTFSPLGASEQPTKASTATKVTIIDNACIQLLRKQLAHGRGQSRATLSPPDWLFTVPDSPPGRKARA